MQDLYLHLRIGQFPPAGSRQQTEAEPAEHGQEHVLLIDNLFKTRTTAGETAADAPAAIYVADFITPVVTGRLRIGCFGS